MEETELVVNPDSILVVTEKGILKRIKCPFSVRSLIAIDELKENQLYLVHAVILNKDLIMVYFIRGKPYCYYYFIILG